jgi:hypothetical protein
MKARAASFIRAEVALQERLTGGEQQREDYFDTHSAPSHSRTHDPRSRSVDTTNVSLPFAACSIASVALTQHLSPPFRSTTSACPRWCCGVPQTSVPQLLIRSSNTGNPLLAPRNTLRTHPPVSSIAAGSVAIACDCFLPTLPPVMLLRPHYIG